MITEDYVPYEIAKLLKEKGFDWEVRRSFFEHDNIYAPCDPSDVPRKDVIAIPTLQMTMKWLRNTFRLEIYPYHNYDNSKWWYEIIKYPNSVAEYECGKDEELDTYEQVCEAAIKYCLENLI